MVQSVRSVVTGGMLTKSKQFCLPLMTSPSQSRLENSSPFHTLTDCQQRKHPCTCGRHVFFNLTFIGFESKVDCRKVGDIKTVLRCKASATVQAFITIFLPSLFNANRLSCTLLRKPSTHSFTACSSASVATSFHLYGFSYRHRDLSPVGLYLPKCLRVRVSIAVKRYHDHGSN